MIRSSSLLGTGCRSTWLLHKSVVHRHVMRAAASKNLEVVSIEDVTKKNPLIVRTVMQSNPGIETSQDLVKVVAHGDSGKSLSEPASLTPSKLTHHYSSLAKFRLTGLVVCSAVTGYAMAPMPTDFTTLGLCLLGTALTSASANTYVSPHVFLYCRLSISLFICAESISFSRYPSIRKWQEPAIVY